MESIVMLRRFEPPLDQQDFYRIAEESVGCLSIYRADWQESLLAEDGHSLICRFEAPDAESIRQLSRGDGAQEKTVWSGTVHDTDRPGLATVVVERRFDEPTTVEALQALESAGAWCLELYRVTFLRTFFSTDRRHMLCLYRAPDAESVRRAQAQAKMPVHQVWACKNYTPENLFS